MEKVLRLAAYLDEHSLELADELVHTIVSQLDDEMSDQEIREYVEMYTDFIHISSEVLSSGRGIPSEQLLDWSRKKGSYTAEKGERVSAVADRYPAARWAFAEKLTALADQFDLTSEEAGFLKRQVHLMLDVSLNEVIRAFEQKVEELIQEAQAEVMHLSAPIVPLQQGLAVLPIVGSINEERAAFLLEKTVPRVAELQLESLIIDFSGLSHIDTMVEKSLFDMYQILKMIGIEPIATGIRPDLAQKITNIGADLSAIKAYSTVREALEQINK